MTKENRYLSPFSRENHLPVSEKPFIVAKKVREVVAVDLQKYFTDG